MATNIIWNFFKKNNKNYFFDPHAGFRGLTARFDVRFLKKVALTFSGLICMFFVFSYFNISKFSLPNDLESKRKLFGIFVFFEK